MPVIQATWEADIRRIPIQDQPGQKVSETPFQQRSRVWWGMLIIPATLEAKVEGSQSKVIPRQKCKTHEILSEK
jgi:hypothetical protein